MSSGAHTHDTSGAHIQDQLSYNFPPKNYSYCVLFAHTGKDTFSLYFVKTAFVPDFILKGERNMIYKVPRGYGASFRLTEVATGASSADEGKYLLNMELHAPLDDTVMEPLESNAAKESSEKMSAEDFGDLPSGFCTSDEGECIGTFGPCEFGQHVEVINGECKCTGGGGGGRK